MIEADVRFLEELCNAFGPSGMEDAVRGLIIERIKPYVDTLKIDGIGNLIATKGQKEKLFVAAHMDEVGFMITGIEDDGKLRFSSIGGVDPKHLSSKRVRFQNPRLIGVIGAKPVHLTKNAKEDASHQDQYRNLYIDIGTTSREASERIVSIGDCAVFSTDFSKMNGDQNVFRGKAFDNRLGCFLLCQLISSKKITDGTFVFTVQEETGLRGASTVMRNNHFEAGIAIDTTTANDLFGITAHRTVSSLKKGPVISFADGATVYQRDLIREIFDFLDQKKISCQTKTRRTGGNEASAIEKVGFGSKSISVSVPCRYIHGPVGLVLAEDIEQTKAALFAIVNYLKGE